MQFETEKAGARSRERSSSENLLTPSGSESDDSDWFQKKPKPKRQTQNGKRVLQKPTTKIEKSTFLRKAIQKNKDSKPSFNKKGRETFGQQSQYHCDECNEDFECGQALGGHMSRVHPGKSNTYQYKVLRRKEREFDRELLRLAKIKHDKEFGVGACLDRVKIRRFKREIRARIKCGDKVEGYTGIAGQEK